MTDLTLHYAPDNASLIVRIALEHQGIAYRTQLVDRGRHAQREADYLALNPNGLIPTLVTPNGPLFETAAILLWLDGMYGDLLPTAQAERMHEMKWLVWLGNTLHPALRMMFYPEKYIDADTEGLRAVTRRRITELLTLLADAKDAQWLETGQGAPAFYLGPMLRWLQIYGGPAWFRLADHPRLHEFAQRAEARDAVVRAAKAEGLGPSPFSAPQLPNPPEGSAI